MEQTNAYIVNGGKTLKGEVDLSGAKNIALKAIIAALLFEKPVTLKNVPRINDVFELMSLIQDLGGRAEFIEKNIAIIDGSTLTSNKVDMLHASKIRVSFMLFAPLLLRFGSCLIANPGGCRIGARSIDRIVEGMQELGVTVTYDSNTGYYEAIRTRDIKGQYTFAKPSHTGTELLILLGVIGKHRVQINNAAYEPEIDELISLLNQNGAHIVRDGSVIVVDGTVRLVQEFPFTIKSDRNEAITFATLALATKGEVTIKSITQSDIATFIKCIDLAGCGIEVIADDCIRFYYKQNIIPVSIETGSHPGFMTDWQPNWAVLMTQASGDSVIHERVFENRFAYVEELEKLGAQIEYIKIAVLNPKEYYYFNYDTAEVYQQAVKIHGPQNLHSGVLHINDLRAGASLLSAALVAEGESIVYGTTILERGYENFIDKVQAIGGDIRRM